jgi:amidohydrolase
MSDIQQLKQSVCDAVDRHRDRVVEVGESIMDEPELGFKEVKTAARVQDIFAEASLPTEHGLALTGVRAVLRGGRPGPTVALMGELDALIVPDHPRCDTLSGAAHACGHNAQIAGLMGAALGLARSDVAKELAGNIVFFAVPAEEYVEIDFRRQLVEQGKTTFLAGKPELVQLGAFDDVDIAVMIHSSTPDHLGGSAGVSASSNGFLAKTVCFRGKAAHAGVAPEQGANALNAANIALHAIHAQRETFRDEDCVRVHPILTKGGDIVNIVPAETRIETYVRARSASAMLDAASKVDRCLKGAAMACGCTVEINTVPGYLPLNNDPHLARLFKDNAEHLFGTGSFRELSHTGGATDAGDLSQIMPVLHPHMTGAAGTVHGRDWHIADPEAGYLAPAKALAMMAVDLLANDAAEARKILADSKPSLTKDQYLTQQKAIFASETWDPATV